MKDDGRRLTPLTTEQIIAQAQAEDADRANRVLEEIARSATTVHIPPFSTHPDLRRVVPEYMARSCLAVALGFEGDKPVIAMANPYDFVALEVVRQEFQRGFRLVTAPHDEVKSTIDELYW